MKNVFYGWWIVSACMAIGFYVAGTIFYGFTAFFEPLVAEFGWSYAQISLAAACGLISLGLLALSLVKTAGLLFVFLLLLPVGAGGGMALRGIIVRDHYGRRRFGRIVGAVMGVSAMGGVAGPTLTGWVFDRTGSYFSVWITLSILMALAMLPALGIRKPPTTT